MTVWPGGLGRRPGGLTGATLEVIACADRTLDQPSARISLVTDWHVTTNRPLPAAFRLAGAAVRAIYRRSASGQRPGQVTGEGFAEPAADRYLVDYGGWGEVCTGGVSYRGRAGTELRHAAYDRDELWLLKALSATVSAEFEGTATLRGVHCRQYQVTVDWARAAAATTAQLPHAHRPRTGPPQTLAVSVWTDGRHVRKISFQEGAPPSTPPPDQPVTARRDNTLELWDFGVSTAKLDWSRIPAFRPAP